MVVCWIDRLAVGRSFCIGGRFVLGGRFGLYRLVAFIDWSLVVFCRQFFGFSIVGWVQRTVPACFFIESTGHSGLLFGRPVLCRIDRFSLVVNRCTVVCWMDRPTGRCSVGSMPLGRRVRLLRPIFGKTELQFACGCRCYRAFWESLMPSRL